MTKINFRDRKDGLTQEQKDFILENYSSMKSNEICKLLKIEYKQLHGYASNKKLIKNKYNAFKKQVAKDRSNYNVRDYILKQKEEHDSPPTKSKYGKYYVEENYFSNIDNEFKAYWLGFLYADGYNSEKTLELTLCKEDESHIEKLKKSLQSSAPIKNKKVRNFEASRISICNLKLCQDLSEKGCVKNKSLILTFPKEDILPKEYQRDFIRGYFDGDGCIYINKELEKCSVSFVGTFDFLKTISDIFNKELNLTQVAILPQGKAYSISWGGVEDCEKIYKYLYKYSNIFLDRKLEKFDTLLCLD